MICPLCAFDDWESYPADHASRAYVVCKHCGEDVVRLDPLIRFEEALALYGVDYFEQMQAYDQSFRRDDFAGWDLLKYESFVEFGPGGDQVLKWLAGFGKYVEGVDINAATREHLRQQGIRTATTALELDRSHFEVALSYHYLEHTRNPLLELRYQFAIADRVLLHVPIGLSELGNPDHNWLLSAEAVCQIVERFGTVLRKEIRPYEVGNALQILAETKR